MNKLESIKNKEKRLIDLKWLTEDIIKHIILQNLKQCVLLVKILEI